MEFFLQEIFFLIVLGSVLFIPGYFLFRAVFRRETFTHFEWFVFAVPASIAVINFLMILLGRTGFQLTAFSIGASLIIFILVCFLFSRFKEKNVSPTPVPSSGFTKKEGLLIITLLFLTIFVKTVYLADTIVPTATDLGHHMYWAKLTAETGQLPEYVKQDIVETDRQYRVSEPAPIDDFIIGEHLFLAALSKFSGQDFISAFPALTLLLINLMTLLAVFVLVLRIFTQTPLRINGQTLRPQTAALFVLLLLGPLYALASPQAKFVSGGVVGNVMGNLFLPVLVYFYWRALTEKNSYFLALAFFLTFGLAYIHHLSTLVFLFVMVFACLIFLLMNIRRLRGFLTEWVRLFFSLPPLLVAMSAVLFFLFILAPSYADPQSVNTALGTPSKATREGLSFLQLTLSTGEGRMGLGLFGVLLLMLLPLRQGYAAALLLGWSLALLVMTIHPEWVFLDIPSNRVSTYMLFPVSILAAVGLAALVTIWRGREETSVLPRPFIIAGFFLFLIFVTAGGFTDNGQALAIKPKAEEAVETYRVSQYLATHNRNEDIILKDHNYLTADAWMKLFFLRDYNYPLSRGLFSRYAEGGNRDEQCTLLMISTPNTPEGQRCYDETGVNLVAINPHYDSVQFKKSKDFNQIYISDDVAVFERIKN